MLLPETGQVDEEKVAFEAEDDDAPPTDDELALRRVKTIGKSEAERLPKSQRTERLARVTAYCTASAFKFVEIEYMHSRGLPHTYIKIYTHELPPSMIYDSVSEMANQMIALVAFKHRRPIKGQVPQCIIACCR